MYRRNTGTMPSVSPDAFNPSPSTSTILAWPLVNITFQSVTSQYEGSDTGGLRNPSDTRGRILRGTGDQIREWRDCLVRPREADFSVSKFYLI